MSDAMDPRGQADFSQDEQAPTAFTDDDLNLDDEEDEDEDEDDDEDDLYDDEEPDTQGDNPLLAGLGSDGQGDLAPEDDLDDADSESDDGPDDLRVIDGR